MAKLSRSNATLTALLAADANLNPRESSWKTGTLNSAGGEIIIPADGTSTVALYLAGTFNLTLEVSGTMDMVNWVPIRMYPIAQAGLNPILAITGTTQGAWVGECAQFVAVKVRCTAFTSGAATAFLIAENGVLDSLVSGESVPNAVTAVGAAGAAVTLTIPAPGTGLRSRLRRQLQINRFASAALTASATPVTGTSTNLPGSLAMTFPADALTLGQMSSHSFDVEGLASSAINTASTIVLPATPGVIWRATALYDIIQ